MNDEASTGVIDVNQLDAANRVMLDGYYDDGAGTVIAMPDIIAVWPDLETGRALVAVEGGAVVPVDEDPREMSLIVRSWGRARAEARKVFSRHPDAEQKGGVPAPSDVAESAAEAET